MKPFEIFIAVGLFAIITMSADTVPSVPLRGTNTIARGTNYPPDTPLTGKALLMSISQPMPPRLPTNNLARLQWIDGDFYALKWEEGDTILMENKPVLKQTKSGKWQLVYPPQP